MNKSDYLRNEVLKEYYETNPAYIELSSTRIDPDGTGGTYPSTVSRTVIAETVTPNQVVNASEVDFGQVGAADDALVCKWWRTMDAASSGNQLHQGLIGTDVARFVASAEDNKIKVLSAGPPYVNDDRIMFDGENLPTGITAGTAYWVLTVDANDNFTISTTQDGSELDITADGEGFAVKGEGITLVENQNLKIPASSFVVTEL